MWEKIHRERKVVASSPTGPLFFLTQLSALVDSLLCYGSTYPMQPLLPLSLAKAIQWFKGGEWVHIATLTSSYYTSACCCCCSQMPNGMRAFLSHCHAPLVARCSPLVPSAKVSSAHQLKLDGNRKVKVDTSFALSVTHCYIMTMENNKGRSISMLSPTKMYLVLYGR